MADITYIRILNGFVYLAAIIDIYSRKIVGCAIGKTLSSELTIAALKMAVATRNTDNLIHHSDRGIQYTCKDYIKILKDNGIRISMSGKGNPYDNAFTESLFKTIKQEEVYLWQYETFSDVVERIPYFIEDVYNRKRLHSSLDYRPPEEYERLLAKNSSRECMVVLRLKVSIPRVSLQNGVKVITKEGMCLWKKWKKIRTKYRNLIKLELPVWAALSLTNTQKAYWHIAGDSLSGAPLNTYWAKLGLMSLTNRYCEIRSVL